MLNREILVKKSLNNLKLLKKVKFEIGLKIKIIN